MNRNAQQWLAALRSKKYKQGQHLLCHRGYYCCMGVACELAVEAGVIKKTTKTQSEKSAGKVYNSKLILYDNCQFVFPEKMYGWLGLNFVRSASNRLEFSVDEGIRLTTDVSEQLAGLNDLKCLSFEYIAQYIEDHHDFFFIGEQPV